LVEEEGAKILGSTIREDTIDPQKLKLSLKINRTNLSSIVATLERFEYKIIGRFQEPQMVDNDKERLDIFLRYLDI
jgi:acetoin utilization protein AcuB